MTTKEMKSFFEQEDTITVTTITERFNLPFLETETIQDYIHVKLHPNDSDTFNFSVTNKFLQFQYRILDQFLISQQKCADHVTNLISAMNLRPCIHHYLVQSISASAIHWKNHRINGGYTIDIHLSDYINRDSLEIGNCDRSDALCSLAELCATSPMDGLNSPGELSSATTPMDALSSLGELSRELGELSSETHRMDALSSPGELSSAMSRMDGELGELSSATHRMDDLSSVGKLSSAMSRMELKCSEILMKTEIMYEQDHVTTSTTSKEKINGCFLQKETTKETIHIDSVSIESDEVSLSLTYEQHLKIHHDSNLNGNKINVILQRRRPNPIATVNHKIPYRFLESAETCYDHIAIVVSELRLSHTTQEYIVSYISNLILHSTCLPLQGSSLAFTVNVNTEVNVNISLDNSSRIVTAVVREMDCPICLNELSSSELSRMELPCSHVFHSHCIMTWLDNKSTCPICRRKVLGEITSIF